MCVCIIAQVCLHTRMFFCAQCYPKILHVSVNMDVPHRRKSQTAREPGCEHDCHARALLIPHFVKRNYIIDHRHTYPGLLCFLVRVRKKDSATLLTVFLWGEIGYQLWWVRLFQECWCCPPLYVPLQLQVDIYTITRICILVSVELRYENVDYAHSSTPPVAA